MKDVRTVLRADNETNHMRLGALFLSYDPSPSKEDIHVTRRLVDSGRMIGIEVLDHLIIGDRKFVSLKEKGYL